MDKIDKGILATLNPKNGKSTYQVSKECGYAYTTVSNRLFKMLARQEVAVDEGQRAGAVVHMWKKVKK